MCAGEGLRDQAFFDIKNNVHLNSIRFGYFLAIITIRIYCTVAVNISACGKNLDVVYTTYKLTYNLQSFKSLGTNKN